MILEEGSGSIRKDDLQAAVFFRGVRARGAVLERGLDTPRDLALARASTP